MIRRTWRAAIIWLAALGSAFAQTISGAPPLPQPVQPTDQIFIFRGQAPVYSTSVNTLISGLTTGVFGPATSTNGFVPQWNGPGGNSLSAGLPVGTTGNNTIVETNGSGLIADSILSTNVTKLGNTSTGSGAVVLATSPTLTTPIIAGTGMSFAGSSSGSTQLLASASAGGVLTLPAVTGTILTTGSGASIPSTLLSNTTGTGSVVLSNGPVINAPTIVGRMHFVLLPTGQPKTYACFDGDNNLISSVFPC